MEDVVFLDATAQAELIRKKEVQPWELVDVAIRRIERLNPALNAVVTPMFDQAIQIAKGTIPQGPFTGVPFLLKDLVASYAGVPLTSGSKFTRDYVPDHDSELVARHKRAGLIVIGKTNTPEQGILPTTEPYLFGPCRNPWNPARTTGGSSGGSAAAVAARIVPMAHANDGGGSIRIPASCCGLFGLKPTRGRNTLSPDFGDIMSGLVAEHAVTRSVRDSAALLDATAGPGIGDPYFAPPKARPFLDEVGADPGKLRIAMMTSAPSGVQIHADCVQAVHEAAKLCSDLGHEVVEAAPEIDGAVITQSFLTLWFSGMAATIDGYAKLMGKKPTAEDFEPGTWAIYQMGSKNTGAAYLLALQSLQTIAREVGRFFADYDLCLTPTLGEPPVPLGTFDSPPSNPMQGLMRATTFVPFTPLCNITGQPAMSVPLYWSKELPIGVHFMGRVGDEATLFRLAAQLEAAQPWANRCPSIATGA